MARPPVAEVGLQGKRQEAQQEERGQRLALKARKTNKGLVALDLIWEAMAATAAMADQGMEAAVAAVEQTEAVAVAVAVVLTLLRQAHPAQEELPLKVPQARQARHSVAQQTSPPTQAGRCPL